MRSPRSQQHGAVHGQFTGDSSNSLNSLNAADGDILARFVDGSNGLAPQRMTYDATFGGR